MKTIDESWLTGLPRVLWRRWQQERSADSIAFGLLMLLLSPCLGLLFLAMAVVVPVIGLGYALFILSAGLAQQVKFRQ